MRSACDRRISAALLGLLAVVAASSVAVTASAPPPPDRSAGGRLAGSVVVGKKIALRRARFRSYSESGRGGMATPLKPEPEEAGNVVVYLEKVPGGASGGRERVVMKQQDESFSPHVLPILKGTTVEFPNGDPYFHNVFSLSKVKSFDLGHYPQGASKSVLFDEPGVVKVYCHLHSDMGAVIVILDNPYYTMASRDGQFSIDHIPPGDYNAVAWHERARPVVERVKILPGETSRISFTVPVTDDPGRE